ncbi:MAG: DUF4249 domain-containing protein [Bacteroidales bacterium]|nr:DUF4249 domain-containing protein [Bacteroidales bacterium]
MKRLILLLAVASVASCIYPYTPELDSTGGRTIVIDGQIYVGSTSIVKLSYVQPITTLGSGAGAPNGTARIEGSDGSVYKPKSNTPVDVIYIPTEKAGYDNQYRLVVEAEGHVYVSDWIEPLKPPTITGVRFDADDDNVYVLASVKAGEDDTGFIGFTSEETWQFHSEFKVDIIITPGEWRYTNLAMLDYDYPYYWCWQTHSNNTLKPVDHRYLGGYTFENMLIQTFPRTSNRNHKKYSILVKASTLSEKAYSYNRHIQDQESSGSDLFTPTPGMMPGNIRCESDESRQVYGLVTAGGTATYRAWLDDRYYIAPKEDLGKLYFVSPDQYDYYYNTVNARPVKYVTIDGVFDVGWGAHRCINCIEAGGTQEKPDFWTYE